MKPDLYTKAVLTVIAACLAVIAFKDTDIMPTLNAAGNYETSKRYGMVPLNADGTMDVNIRSCSPTLKVDVSDIKSSRTLNVCIADINTWDKLSVKVDEMSSSIVVPVKMKQ